jgi:hypothetical protein
MCGTYVECVHLAWRRPTAPPSVYVFVCKCHFPFLTHLGLHMVMGSLLVTFQRNHTKCGPPKLLNLFNPTVLHIDISSCPTLATKLAHLYQDTPQDLVRYGGSHLTEYLLHRTTTLCGTSLGVVFHIVSAGRRATSIPMKSKKRWSTLSSQPLLAIP